MFDKTDLMSEMFDKTDLISEIFDKTDLISEVFDQEGSLGEARLLEVVVLFALRETVGSLQGVQVPEQTRK